MTLKRPDWTGLEASLFADDSLRTQRLSDSALKTNLDIGFRVLKLDTSSLRDTSATVNDTSQEFANFECVRSNCSAEDLLFQMLLETHIPLSEPIVKAKVVGNEMLFVGCDGDGIDDSARTNLQQVFNQFSPTTSIKVI